ncbi:MAG: hypothetical protein QW251_00890 [Desulfurococcaceae archaeon]
MKKVLLGLSLFTTITFASADSEIKAYEVGWTDGFRAGYSLKEAKPVNVPSGFWLYMPTENIPLEHIAFYLWTAQRIGLKPYWTEKEIVFNVFNRRADAVYYKELLEGKGIEGLRIEKREATTGYEGGIKTIDTVSPKGVRGVIYHLERAIRSAEDIDPTVLNRNLLIKDLEDIMKQLRKWQEGQKGYQKVLPQEEDRPPEIIQRFLEERK